MSEIDDLRERVARQSAGYEAIEAWAHGDALDLEDRSSDGYYLREIKIAVRDHIAVLAGASR